MKSDLPHFPRPWYLPTSRSIRPDYFNYVPEADHEMAFSQTGIAAVSFLRFLGQNPILTLDFHTTCPSGIMRNAIRNFVSEARNQRSLALNDMTVVSNGRFHDLIMDFLPDRTSPQYLDYDQTFTGKLSIKSAVFPTSFWRNAPNVVDPLCMNFHVLANGRQYQKYSYFFLQEGTEMDINWRRRVFGLTDNSSSQLYRDRVCVYSQAADGHQTLKTAWLMAANVDLGITETGYKVYEYNPMYNISNLG